MKHSSGANAPRQPKTRINREINVPEVLVIDADGSSMGVCSVAKAIQAAQEQGLDLVEVSPAARPPVCRIMDYGKYKYEMNKKSRGLQKKQGLKEIRMQPKISEHDLEFKTRHVREFLEEGNKVKISVRFRGRELSHTQLGTNVLKSIEALLVKSECKFAVDKAPIMEGRMMSMVLSPSLKKGPHKDASGAEGAHDTVQQVAPAAAQQTAPQTTPAQAAGDVAAAPAAPPAQ